MDSVARHYGVPGLLDAILDALRAQGKDLDSLTPTDLAPVDEFHIRGREATAELAQLAGVRERMHVLDAGSGLGGSSRFLASTFGCHVTGIDLTPRYCDTARALSRLVGLEKLNDFHCADALEMPFPSATFDLAWTQHAQMNIERKSAFYGEIARVLRPRGRLVFHDILAGPEGPPHYPVHWAEDPSMSHLIEPARLLELLEETGFRVIEWLDTTDISRDWYLATLQRRRRGVAAPLGLHLLMGETAALKFENVARNLQERRISVFQGLLEKP